MGAIVLLSAGCESPSTPSDPEPAPVFALSVVTGGEQRGFVGTTLTRPLVVSLKVDGAPAAGRSIRFEVISGPGSVDPATATTDSDGLATTRIGLGATAGSVAVRVSGEGFEVQPVTTTFEVLQAETRRLVAGIGEIGDMVLDPGRLRVYVTRPQANTIDVYSAESGAALLSLPVGSQPRGASLSLDGNELFVALFGGGAVAVVDLTSLVVVPISVQETTGHARTWDVVEAVPGHLFVSASPSSSGFAWIAKVDRATPANAIRVASNRIIRAQPTFTVHPSGDRLFVSEGFSPNSLYALDLTQNEAPIVHEDQHGSVSGVWWAQVDRSGQRVYLGSGQVLDAETFHQVGSIPSGASLTSLDGAFVFVLGSDGLRTFETSTFTEVGGVDFDVAQGNPRMDRFPDSDVIVLHSGGELWLVDLGG